MMKTLNRIIKMPPYIFLLSIYPSLALLATNIREVNATAVLRPLTLSLLGAIIAYVIIFHILDNELKASLITVILVVVFLNYGHVIRVFAINPDLNHKTIIELLLYAAAIIIVAIPSFYIISTRQFSDNWRTTLNTIAIILIVFPIGQIFVFSHDVLTSNPEAAKSATNPNIALDNKLDNYSNTTDQNPDIYYIILDGYSRADTLETLGYDNSKFLAQLENKGFYIASCSTSNYRATLLSIPAALNMDYLWDAIPNTGDKDLNVAPLYDSLVHNRVRKELQQRGYKIISFQTGYQWDEWTDADLYITPTSQLSSGEISFSSITPFEYIYLKNTALYSVLEGSRFATHRYYSHYNRVMYTLDKLPEVALMPGPKFVYAHIMAPHHPFIFLSDGALNTDSRYYDSEKGYPSDDNLFTPGYLNSIQFLNSRIPSIIDELIKNSDTQPIIILQGDHGFVIPERRYNIFNTYYLPGQDYDEILYPSISPVNTFRVVFNQFFNMDMELREDLMIRADIGGPYRKGRSKPFPEMCP
jgi:hypothetical protein